MATYLISSHSFSPIALSLIIANISINNLNSITSFLKTLQTSLNSYSFNNYDEILFKLSTSLFTKFKSTLKNWVLYHLNFCFSKISRAFQSFIIMLYSFCISSTSSNWVSSNYKIYWNLCNFSFLYCFS